jgi:hypothetical protein
LRRQEGEKFTDRAMDHIIITRHHYRFNDEYTLKTQLDYMTEYKRTGSNEVWGKGLYDFNRYGGGLTFERKFNNKLSLSVSQQYHYMDFPNYTDLLAEFQTGGESAETSTGKQNHNLYQTGLALNYGQARFSLDFLLMAYTKQKVVSETVQPDKTYYSDTLQRDTILSAGVRYEQALWKRILLTPELALKAKSSNQNYQHFTVATSSVPVRYIGSYYDYNAAAFSFPCTLLLSSRWEFFCNPEWEWKFYSSRPPRDADNNFVSGTQKNELLVLSLGFTLKPNDITRTSFFYTYQSQVSNMKFEKYLPYNYGAHFFGVNFNYTY